MCIKKGSSKVRKMMKKLTALAFGIAVAVSLTGCGSLTGGKRIIRVSHAQSETHPEHLGLLAFKEYVEEKLVPPAAFGVTSLWADFVWSCGVGRRCASGSVVESCFSLCIAAADLPGNLPSTFCYSDLYHSRDGGKMTGGGEESFGVKFQGGLGRKSL